MLNSLARRVTSFFITKGYLKKEIFVWSVFVLEKKFVTLLGISWLIFLGTVLSGVSATLVFIVGFYFLRSRAGGYHASSFRNCLILSSATVVANAYIVTPLIIRFSPGAPIGIGFVCFFILQVLGTVANPSVQFTKSEMWWQCVLMRLILTVQFALVTGFVVFGIPAIYAANLSSGMGFVTISSIIGKIKMRRESDGEQSIIAGV